MPKYVEKTLNKLNYKCVRKTQYAPHKWITPIYGKNKQFATPEDTAPILDKNGVKHTQKTVGSFLYYGRAVDSMILTTINDIDATQAKPTETTLEKIQMFNGPIHVECRILRHVVTSAAETAALFYNAQMALELLHIFRALGHPQPAVPIKTDNATAASFVDDTLKQKRSKAWDVRYHWLVELQRNKIFKMYWDKGANNLANYHTKHHPPSHHQKMRPLYILKNH